MITSNNILSDYYSILGDNCVHTIRMYIEVFGAALCRITPIYMLSTLMSQLQDFNHTQQKLSSLFIILGHICVDNSSASTSSVSSSNGGAGSSGDNSGTGSRVGTGGVGTGVGTGSGAGIDSKVLTLTMKRQICHLLIAWSSCASGLPRAIAQLVIHTLGGQIKAATTSSTNTTTCIGTHTHTTATDVLQVEEVGVEVGVATEVETKVTSSNINTVHNIHAAVSASDPDPLDTSIYQVCTFLEQNRDSIKMLQRQQGFFSEYSLSTRCTLLGLLDVQRRDSDNTGDYYIM